MMKTSAVDDAAQVVVGRASGYSHSPSGAVENASFIAMSYPGAAGSIRSMADDLCLWHSALFGGKIVKPAGLSEMITPARLNNGTLPMRPPSPDKAAKPELEPIRYGFGLQIEAFEGRRMIGHNNGFVSALHTFPDQRTTVAILVNGDGADRPDFGPRFKALQDAGARFALMA
jgi:CubicO group peptidase (beta-lactamase class C family)